MHVFVAGATGILGRRLVRQFVARGHEVVALARSPENESIVRELGGTPARGDLFDAKSLEKGMERCDVAIRAATSIPTTGRTRPRDFAMNDRIRTEGTRAMLAAASRSGVRAYVHESVVWAAASEDGSPFDEDAPLRRNKYLAGTQEGERIAREEGERRGIEVAILRCGNFYSADAEHTRTIGERLSRRALPIIGDGRATWSLVHADDVAGAFAEVAENPRGGLWHIVDNQPVSLADLFTHLANKLGARAPRHVPIWLARLATGRLTMEILTTSFMTSSARFQRDFRWRPRYPTYREGYDEVLAAWRQEGFPRRKGG